MKNVMLFLVCIAFLCLPILASGEMSAEVAQRLKRAQQGDAKAQYALGLTYYLGKGVPQNYTEAAKWVRLAAEQGFARAQSVLGGAYDSGLGVPQDCTEAVKWYRLAAEQGDAEAQHNLGLAYDSGVGVPQDYKEAVKWFRLSAEQGYAKAQYELGLTYDSGKGVPQDSTEAVKWYRLAAEKGYAKAQHNLGVAYASGEGVPQDSQEAVKWCRLAAEQGLAGAQCNLGVAYDLGKVVSQDYTEAVKWYRLAAEQGCANAQYNLGLAYYYGRGVSKDNLQACGLIKLAAEQGLAEAKKDYSTLLKEMSSQKNVPAGMLSRALKRAGSGATLMIGAVLVGGVVQLIRWLAVKGVRKRFFPFFGKQNVIFGECPRCRLLNPPTATRCDCGYDFPTDSIQKSYATRNKAVSQELQLQDVRYGGFWRRVFASILDDMIINVGYGIFMLIFLVMLCPERIASFLIIPILVIRFTALWWLYFAWFESSRHQATIGKQIFGLMVQTEDGRTLSFARATGRYWSKLISALPLGIGFIAVGLHRKKQGFHDSIAKTVVVHRVPDDNRLRNLAPWLLALIISILATLDVGFVYFNIPKFMPQCSPAQRLMAAILGATIFYGWVVFLLVFIVKSARNRKRQ